jgi:CHAT domain-containing protein
VRYKRLVRAGEAWNDVPSYAAFVLGADRAGPRAIDLGDAESVDTLASRWREAASNPPPRGLASDDRRGGDAYADVAGPLRRAIWDPLERSLEGASLVLVVADGALLQVNLPALPDDAGRFLVESRRTIHQIFAERDLARGGGTAAGANALLALGGADYGDPGAGATGLVATKAAVATPIVAPADGVPPHRPFDPLPGTRQEAMAIGELWREKGAAGRGGKTILLLGRDASESTFKRRAGEARVLHLATHAFFPWEKILDRAGRSSPGAVSSNPLMGSGLAFAGANAGASTSAAGDDGVLLGEEIASLDLSSVEWVVLSACGTGLGTIQEREGVLGLRRAFQEAGAATIISSLWEVEDRSTLAWMLSLYRARLSGRSTSDSMRQASLDFLADARSNGRSTHPYYWGAFVAVGDWR